MSPDEMQPTCTQGSGGKAGLRRTVAIIILVCALLMLVSTFLPWYSAPTDPACSENPVMLSGWNWRQQAAGNSFFIRLDPGWQFTGLWGLALAAALGLCGVTMLLAGRGLLVILLVALAASGGGLLVAIKLLTPSAYTAEGYLQFGRTTSYSYGAWLLAATSVVIILTCLVALIAYLWSERSSDGTP